MNRNVIIAEHLIVRTDGDDGMFSISQKLEWPLPDQLVTMTRDQAKSLRDALNKLLEPVF